PAAPARVGRRRDRADDGPRSTPAESSASWFPDRYRRRTSGRIRFIRLVGLVVRPAAPGLAGLQPLRGRRAVGRLLEAVVGTAVAGRVLAAGVDHRLPVELALADAYRRARLRTLLGQRLLHTESGQPVGEVPDRLVVVEVGLPHPALRPGTVHHEHVVLDADGEPAVVDRARPDDDPGGLRRRRGRAMLADRLGQRVRQLLEALVGR